ERRDDEQEKRALEADMEAALLELPLDLRAPLVLHFMEGRSHEEVAEVVGCPTGTASSRIRRGLERMRSTLERVGYALGIADIKRWARAAHGRPVPVPAAPSAALLEHKAAALAKSALAALLLVPALVLGLGAASVAIYLHGVDASAASGAPRETASAPERSEDTASPTTESGSSPAASPADGPRTPSAPAGPRAADAASSPPSVAPEKPARRGPGFLVTVRGEDGALVAGATVVLRAEEKPDGRRTMPAMASVLDLYTRAEPYVTPLATATSDENGEAWFFAGALQPAPSAPRGPKPTYVVEARRGLLLAARHDLDAPGDETKPVALTLAGPEKCQDGRGALLARVLSPEGAPLANARLQARVSPASYSHLLGVSADDSDFGVSIAVLTDESGRFALANLVPDTYGLLLEDGSHAPARSSVAVTAGAVSALEVRLAP